MYNRFFLLVFPFLFFSCLNEKDGNCPPEYRVVLGVKDKNYSNAGNVLGIIVKDNQLPFSGFISNLYYQLQNLSTGAVVVNSGEITVDGDEPTYALDFTGQPAGRYVLTVFGNIDRLTETKDNLLTYSLHADGKERQDTYILSDTFDFPPTSTEQHFELVRAKGALFVQIENVPDSVARIDVQVQSVYQDIDQKGIYKIETTVVKSFTTGLTPQANLLTVLAPSFTGKESMLRLALYTAGADMPFMFIPDIYLTIKRNEVTAFQMNFKPEGGVEVWISINGSWVKYHDVDINLN